MCLTNKATSGQRKTSETRERLRQREGREPGLPLAQSTAEAPDFYSALILCLKEQESLQVGRTGRRGVSPGLGSPIN